MIGSYSGDQTISVTSKVSDYSSKTASDFLIDITRISFWDGSTSGTYHSGGSWISKSYNASTGVLTISGVYYDYGGGSNSGSNADYNVYCID